MTSLLKKPLNLEHLIQVIQPKTSSQDLYVRLHNGNGCCIKVDPSDKIGHVLNVKVSKEFELPQAYKALFLTKEIKNFDLTL